MRKVQGQVMDDYTELLKRTADLVASNRSDPALNAYWIASRLDTDLSVLDTALFKSSRRSCEEYIEHHRISWFCRLLKQTPHRQVEEVAAECGLYSLCKLRESFYQHLGIHLEPFVVMSGRALEDLQIRHNNGNDALILKEV
jgi:transcriptional regulator GlxA family with amidase domain